MCDRSEAGRLSGDYESLTRGCVSGGPIQAALLTSCWWPHAEAHTGREADPVHLDAAADKSRSFAFGASCHEGTIWLIDRHFRVARNPDPESHLPHLIWLPIEGVWS